MTPTPYEVRHTDSLVLGIWQRARGLTGKTVEVGYGVEQEVAEQVQRSLDHIYDQTWQPEAE